MFIFAYNNLKTNKMENQLSEYKIQINEIALFAKRINYNIENGIEELIKLWFKDGIKFQNFVNDNEEDFIRTTKKFLN